MIEDDRDPKFIAIGVALGAGLGVSVGAVIGAVSGEVARWVALGPSLGASVGLAIGVTLAIVTQPKARGICRQCGYSTKGLRSRICPECGADLSRSAD